MSEMEGPAGSSVGVRSCTYPCGDGGFVGALADELEDELEDGVDDELPAGACAPAGAVTNA